MQPVTRLLKVSLRGWGWGGVWYVTDHMYCNSTLSSGGCGPKQSLRQLTPYHPPPLPSLSPHCSCSNSSSHPSPPPSYSSPRLILLLRPSPPFPFLPLFVLLLLLQHSLSLSVQLGSTRATVDQCGSSIYKRVMSSM